MNRPTAERLTSKAVKFIKAGPIGGNPKQVLRILQELADQTSVAQRSLRAMVRMHKSDKLGISMDISPFRDLLDDLQGWGGQVDDAIDDLERELGD